MSSASNTPSLSSEPCPPLGQRTPRSRAPASGNDTRQRWLAGEPVEDVVFHLYKLTRREFREGNRRHGAHRGFVAFGVELADQQADLRRRTRDPQVWQAPSIASSAGVRSPQKFSEGNFIDHLAAEVLKVEAHPSIYDLPYAGRPFIELFV
jgi:hypothetical protein